MLALGIVGIVFIVIALWGEKSKRNRMFFLVGGALLLVYSTYLENFIFMGISGILIAQGVLDYRKHHGKEKK